MNTLDELEERESHETDEPMKKPVWESLPDIDERVKEALKEGHDESRTDTARDSVIPRIKGLDILKEGAFAVDLEKTVNDMFGVIKSMEAQLERVLSINSHLEKESNDAKQLVNELKKAKSEIESKIVRMEKELPSKRELQMEIDQLIEERNNVQPGIREANEKVEKMQKQVMEYQRRVGNLEEEKRDAIAEINFLQSKFNAASEEIKLNAAEINELTGEKLAYVEKTKTLEEQLNTALDEKFEILNELKKSKKALIELHSAISDKKLQAKKSFYKSTD